MKNLIYLISGLLSGILIVLMAILFWSQSVLFQEKESLYSFDESVRRLEESVKVNQWRTPAVHDMQKTMASIGKEVLQARIYELCKPEYAYEVVRDDDGRRASTMLPCRVAIYEKTDGKTYVSLMNMTLMARLMNGSLPEMMKKASADIEVILAPLYQ
jgi:uncharacterized protein (DUF302 family)